MHNARSMELVPAEDWPTGCYVVLRRQTFEEIKTWEFPPHDIPPKMLINVLWKYFHWNKSGFAVY